MKSFFVMDENFLLYKARAMELLDQMKAAGKAWSLYVFSSANALKKYSMRELVELGVSWVWMGLESPESQYQKLDGTDTVALTRELQSHGIGVLGSTIVGLEHHTPENIAREIEHAVSHDTDFHQFMLYTPVPGTPLYEEMVDQGRLLPGVDLADIHGQDHFNFQHAAIPREQSKRLLDWAFRLDYERNGPSVYRLAKTMLEGWKKYRYDPDPRVRERIRDAGRGLRGGYGAALFAMEKYLRTVKRRGEPEHPRLAQGHGARTGPLPALGQPDRRPRAAVAGPPRRAQVPSREANRTDDVLRAPQLARNGLTPVRLPA